MKKIVVLGAGISGHTAALFLKRYLGNQAEIHVVSPAANYNWIPSNIWVGVGKMQPSEVKIALAPIYKQENIIFHQGKGIELWPEGNDKLSVPFINYETTNSDIPDKKTLEYDYLINATGPKLNFGATPGLGPDGYSVSVCTPEHAVEAAQHLNELILEMKKGHKKTLVIGTGHGMCTCEGAAFEYVFNVDFELRQHNVRHMAELIYITNEAQLGDFGVNGMQLNVGGFLTSSKIFAESLYLERDVKYILGAHVRKVEKNNIEYETLDGKISQLACDFAMLLPPFRGNSMLAFDKAGTEITEQIYSVAGFMKVDANYQAKNYTEWSHEDWPKHYINPKYNNIYAIGIAFAPPHQISIPRTNPNGVIIAPAPPRTGMPSATMGRIVARNIANIIKGNSEKLRTCSMAELGAACVASAGADLFHGSAVSIVMSPVVPNFKDFPLTGRNDLETYGEIGLAGHWLKRALHTIFIYKAEAKPFWWVIPE
jgi:sulfide:quinone oxidoreductase